MSKQEQIQYVKDAYSSKSVNYVIDSQGQNSRYRYAMVVRKNKYIHLFYNREKHDLLQFERTKEGLQLYPIYFGEDFILCTPEGGLPLNDLFPEKLRKMKSNQNTSSFHPQKKLCRISASNTRSGRVNLKFNYLLAKSIIIFLLYLKFKSPSSACTIQSPPTR